MITVSYEEYINDYNRQNFKKSFQNLGALENWIFEQMQTDYRELSNLWFPKPGYIGHISMRPTMRGPLVWIHMIENDYGIIFSDGKMTANQKHMSDVVAQWCDSCRARQKNLKFNFV